MIHQAKAIGQKVLNFGPSLVTAREFRRQKFQRFNERPVEFGFVFRMMAQIYPLHVLDVGTGTTALPHLMRNCGCLVTAVDNVRDYWSFGMSNRHYHVIDDDITNTRLKGPFDMVTCISVLEHIEKHNDAMRNMFSLLKPKGHLVLTCPYTEKGYVRNVYELAGSSYGQGAPYITQSYSRNELNRWVEANEATIVEQEFWQYWEGEHWTVGKQIIPPKKVSAADQHQLTCVLLQKN